MTVKYYLAGGQRITMRTSNNSVSYLLSDHLGSTSLTPALHFRRAVQGRVRATWTVLTPHLSYNSYLPYLNIDVLVGRALALPRL